MLFAVFIYSIFKPLFQLFLSSHTSNILLVKQGNLFSQTCPISEVVTVPIKNQPFNHYPKYNLPSQYIIYSIFTKQNISLHSYYCHWIKDLVIWLVWPLLPPGATHLLTNLYNSSLNYNFEQITAYYVT